VPVCLPAHPPSHFVTATVWSEPAHPIPSTTTPLVGPHYGVVGSRGGDEPKRIQPRLSGSAGTAPSPPARPCLLPFLICAPPLEQRPSFSLVELRGGAHQARSRGEGARTSGELQGITHGGSFGAAFTGAPRAHACGRRHCLNRILCSPDGELGVCSHRDESSPRGAGGSDLGASPWLGGGNGQERERNWETGRDVRERRVIQSFGCGMCVVDKKNKLAVFREQIWRMECAPHKCSVWECASHKFSFIYSFLSFHWYPHYIVC
jgi:hypothetical protein